MARLTADVAAEVAGVTADVAGGVAGVVGVGVEGDRCGDQVW